MIHNHAHQKLFPFIIIHPTCSSHYPFLYSTCKRPMSAYATGTLLNCQQPQNPPSSMMLNCHHGPSGPATSTSLNCNLAQTLHDMPSGHVGHLSHLRLLGHWTYSGMPSGPYIILRHLGQLGHPSHF